MTPTLETKARARVAAAVGAILLDRHQPGWASRITRPITVNDLLDCPVAQVYGSWSYGIARLTEAAGDPSLRYDTDRYGFTVGSGDPDALNAAWETEVALRRRRPLGRLRGYWRNLTARVAA